MLNAMAVLSGLVLLILIEYGLWLRSRRRHALQGTTQAVNSDPLFDSVSIISEDVQEAACDLTESESTDQLDEPLTILSISLLAQPKQPFAGYDLLQTLLHFNLRFGEYDIFHYFELDKPLFSVASATKPGTFPIDAMQSYKTQGITFFMTLHNDVQLETDFERMVQIATRMAKNLGGYLVDDEYNALTDSSLESMKQVIREYLRADSNAHTG